MTYQKNTGALMANSHPGSYCGQDAYNDMLITKSAERERERVWTYAILRSDSFVESKIASTMSARQYKSATDLIVTMRLDD